MSRLEGKVAIVTGAGSGQGAEHVRAMTDLGAKVVATDVNGAAVEAVVAGIEREGTGRAVAMTHDVACSDAWAKVIEAAAAAFGPVTVLVNNAGVLTHDPFETVRLEQWQRIMNVNAWSVFAGIQAVVPGMRAAGGGSIINISSTSALSATGGFSAYTASKGAINAMTRAAAVELASANIRVNCICPGIIRTPMVEAVLSTEAAINAAAATLPVGRLGRSRDVAMLVAYLASDESTFTTGQVHVIDGGATIEGGGAYMRERVAAVLG